MSKITLIRKSLIATTVGLSALVHSTCFPIETPTQRSIPNPTHIPIYAPIPTPGLIPSYAPAPTPTQISTPTYTSTPIPTHTPTPMPDTEPPQLTSIRLEGGELIIGTDEKAQCYYSISSHLECNFDIESGTRMLSSDQGKTHTLECGLGPFYYIRCKDGSGNEECLGEFVCLSY